MIGRGQGLPVTGSLTPSRPPSDKTRLGSRLVSAGLRLAPDSANTGVATRVYSVRFAAGLDGVEFCLDYN